jgi:hypothetical protein
MNRTLKKGLILTGIGLMIYQGTKGAKIAKAIKNLAAPLKQHLKDQYGEEPKLSIAAVIGFTIRTTVIVRLNAETIAAQADIEDSLFAYIRDKYPELMAHKLKIHVVDRALSDAEMLKQISPLVYKFVGKTLEKRDAKKAAAEKEEPVPVEETPQEL